MVLLTAVPTAELQLELIKRGEELPVRVVSAPPTIPVFPLWEQIDLALRLADPESELSFIYEEVIAPGVSGWVTAVVPEDRVCFTYRFTEWGDPCVRVKHAYNTQESLYIALHYVPPNPTTFTKIKHWTFGKKWYLWRENTDLVNSAEYHLVAQAVIPKEVVRTAILNNLRAQAEEFLGIKGKV